jgi:hypothetical protein
MGVGWQPGRTGLTLSMQTYDHATAQVRIASGLILMIGLWMMVAPWVLAYSIVGAATWNSVFSGFALAVLAIARMAVPFRYEVIGWLGFAVGLWLLFAPFLLNFSAVSSAMWNSVSFGLIILVLAAWSAVSGRTTAPGSSTF